MNIWYDWRLLINFLTRLGLQKISIKDVNYVVYELCLIQRFGKKLEIFFFTLVEEEYFLHNYDEEKVTFCKI